MKRQDDELECGTPLYDAVSEAVDDYHNGRPISDGITVDDVEMTILDDWKKVATISGDYGPVDIDAPLFLVKGEERPERMFLPDDINGFTPVRGHEYQLKVRRFFLTNEPFFHQYELIEIINDRLSNKD